MVEWTSKDQFMYLPKPLPPPPPSPPPHHPTTNNSNNNNNEKIRKPYKYVTQNIVHIFRLFVGCYLTYYSF